MLSIGTAYFYRLNKQPAKDLRRLKSLPVSVFCIQDSSKIAQLLEQDGGPIVRAGDLAILGEVKSHRIEKLSITTALIAEFEGYTIININAHKDNFSSQSASNLRYAAGEIFTELKRLIKSFKSNNVYVVGNLNLLNEFPGITKRRSASHLFKKVGFDYVYNGDNYIAYRGDEPTVQIVESKELGSDQDWMVATF